MDFLQKLMLIMKKKLTIKKNIKALRLKTINFKSAVKKKLKSYPPKARR